MQRVNQKRSWLDYVIPKQGIWFYPILYLQFLTLAELLTTLVEPVSGLAIHSFTLIAILIHGAVERNQRNRRFLLSLALAPLIRLLSLSLPLAGRPQVDWYLYVGALVFVAAYFSFRITGLTAKRIGINLKNLWVQPFIGLIGIGLGYLEYIILRPEPLIEELTWANLIWPAIILTIFTGLLEEIVFRGIIQEASLASYGKFGITYGAILFAVLHIGYGSFIDVLFVFSVAMLFGILVQKTGSLVGVTIAHALTNIGLLLVFPFLLGPY